MVENRLSHDDSGGFNLRSMIGEYAGLLRWLDEEWFEDNRDKLFNFTSSDGDETKGLGWAAWNSFLYSTTASRDNFNALRPQFEQVAALVSESKVDENNRDDPFSKAGKYLLIVYLNGHLQLDNDTELLPRFLLSASKEIRMRVLVFAGMILRNDDDVSPEILLRYEKLWDWYWETIGKTDSESDPKSNTFGFWFISGNLEPNWALSRLGRFVEVVPRPEPDHEIFGTLAKICDANLFESGKILKSLIGSYRENWQIHGSRTEVHEILRRLIGDEETKRTAVGIINDLGRRGFTEYRELIE